MIVVFLANFQVSSNTQPQALYENNPYFFLDAPEEICNEDDKPAAMTTE
jgi:hypothetical protein